MELAEDQKQTLRRLARAAHQSGMKLSVRRIRWAVAGVDQDYAEAIVRFWQEIDEELEREEFQAWLKAHKPPPMSPEAWSRLLKSAGLRPVSDEP